MFDVDVNAEIDIDVEVDVDVDVDASLGADEAARDQARPSRDGGLRFPLRRGIVGEEGRRRGTPAVGVGVRLQPQVGPQLAATAHLLPEARGSVGHNAVVGDHVQSIKRVL